MHFLSVLLCRKTHKSLYAECVMRKLIWKVDRSEKIDVGECVRGECAVLKNTNCLPSKDYFMSLFWRILFKFD